jgi:predicted Zn-dependent protease
MDMIQKIPILISILLAQLALAAGQSPLECKTNKSAPPAGLYAWPTGDVKVYFMLGMFTKGQQQALLRAMEFWSQAAKRNDAGITLLYAGETDSTRNCNSCLTVIRREVYSDNHKYYALFVPFGKKLDEPRQDLLKSARIELDVGTTEPRALQGYMAHELGHGMGLWDCPKCKKKQTIMRFFPGVNKDNGLIEPSVCDLEVMRQVFEKQRRITNAGNEATAMRVESGTP